MIFTLLITVFKILSIVILLFSIVAYFTTAKGKEFGDRFLDSLIFNFYGPALLVNGWLILAFFISLFLIGNPYLSLLMVLSCFIFYNWYYTISVINSKFFLGVNAFILIIYILMEFNFIISILFAIKFILFLLIINTFMSVYNTKVSDFMKISLILLGFYLLLLGIFLAIVKIYFFNAISFFAFEKINYPIVFNTMPSEVFLSFKNWNFFTITKNPLFLIDFSNDDMLNDLAIQLSQFPKTKWVFYYVAQMIFLSTNNINLVLIFV